MPEIGDDLRFQVREFREKGDISPFGPPNHPIPKTGNVYNDDLVWPFYQKSALTLAGEQRTGLLDEHWECHSYDEHIRAALTSHFPRLSIRNHPPPSAIQSTNFLRDCEPQLILKFLDAHLSRLGDLAVGSGFLESTGEGLAPSQIAPAAGRVKLAAHSDLEHQCDLGGQVWIRRFLCGFQLVGDLSQRRG